MKKTLLSMALCVASGGVFAAHQVDSTAENRQHLAVAIYNDGLALVRESRRVDLAAGENEVALRDVSAQIMSETVSLASVSGDLQLLEQNFDYDLLSEGSLLNKYVGKEVLVISRNQDGSEKSEKAKLLANNHGVVLQYADRIETGLAHNARLSFAEVPANLRDRPTLNVRLQNQTAMGEQVLDLSYLTQGLFWQADYVATLSPDETKLNLSGWVTLNNQSGSRYENALLQLVAGDVNRAPREMRRERRMHEEAMMMVAAPAAAMQEEALFEYHLYTLERPTTIENNQAKQVALLSAAEVPVRKEYRLQGNDYYYYQDNAPEFGDERKVEVYVEFDNKEEAQLGMPLPRGVMRMYKNDSQNRTLFIGEDRINHTAKNETVRLKLGDAFDIKGLWKHIATEPVNNAQLVGKLLGGKGKAYDISVSVLLSNAKKEAVVVKVVEPIPGFWEVQSESHAHQKVGANLAQWQVPVPAEGKTELTYTVRVRFE